MVQIHGTGHQQELENTRIGKNIGTKCHISKDRNTEEFCLDGYDEERALDFSKEN